MSGRALRLVFLFLWIVCLWSALTIFSRRSRSSSGTSASALPPLQQITWVDFFSRAILPSLPVATELTPPLRPPDGQGAFITLGFLVLDHLGEDWAVAPGNGSLGEPVYALGPGWVSDAQDYQGAWGKCVFIVYRMPDNRWPPFIEVMCGEMNEIDVAPGSWVKGGQRIGTVGTGGGIYLPHLHWEVRETVGLGLGAGFDPRHDGWLEPSDTLRAHRGSRVKFPLAMQTIAAKDRPKWGSE